MLTTSTCTDAGSIAASLTPRAKPFARRAVSVLVLAADRSARALVTVIRSHAISARIDPSAGGSREWIRYSRRAARAAPQRVALRRVGLARPFVPALHDLPAARVPLHRNLAPCFAAMIWLAADAVQLSSSVGVSFLRLADWLCAWRCVEHLAARELPLRRVAILAPSLESLSTRLIRRTGPHRVFLRLPERRTLVLAPPSRA